MADYAEMYRVLFQAMTKVIDIMQEAQRTTEEMYISADDTIITLLSPTNGSENEEGDHT